MDEGFAYTGRIVIMPGYSNPDLGLHLGMAGSYRTPTTDAEIPGSFRYSTRSLTSINRKKYLDTDDIVNVDHALMGGLELAAYYKGFRLQGEYITNKVLLNDNLGEENFGGFYMYGSWLMFGGKHNYDAAAGEFTQPSRGKKWELELAFRYDYIDLNSRQEGVMGGAADGYTLGLNWHANENVKFMLNYAILNHGGTLPAKGVKPVGHDIDGTSSCVDPTQVIDAAGKAGEDFSFLSIRCEIDF
ncbi:MAG: porin [Bacteroidales bacterium]